MLAEWSSHTHLTALRNRSPSTTISTLCAPAIPLEGPASPFTPPPDDPAPRAPIDITPLRGKAGTISCSARSRRCSAMSCLTPE